MKDALACTRRGALAVMALGAGAAAFAPLRLAATETAPAQPVTTYFADGLMRDPTGRLPPYRAPLGYRGARSPDYSAIGMSGYAI